MENKYVGLRIYNNFDWRVVLHVLENNNYTWASGDKPSTIHMNILSGVIFMNPFDKTLTLSKNVSATPSSCNCYIVVR